MEHSRLERDTSQDALRIRKKCSEERKEEDGQRQEKKSNYSIPDTEILTKEERKQPCQLKRMYSC
jgi:hypothetical protein